MLAQNGLIRQLFNVVDNLVLEKSVVRLAWLKLFMHNLERVRDGVVLPLQSSEARQNRVVDALYEDHFVEWIELLHLQVLVPPLNVGRHLVQYGVALTRVRLCRFIRCTVRCNGFRRVRV